MTGRKGFAVEMTEGKIAALRLTALAMTEGEIASSMTTRNDKGKILNS